jgi:uncharacterized Fe-S radical SAM superfamily protein PflX
VTVCDNALPYVWNGNEYFTEDTYMVTLEGQDGDCDTLATLILTISPIIETTEEVTVCDNALPYVWNGNEYFTEDTYTVTLEGQNGDCDTLATLILTISPIIETTEEVTVCDNALPYVWNGNEYFTEDTYTVTLEGQNGDCDTLATLILTISPIIETTEEVTVCDNALPYVWNGNEYFSEDTYMVTLEGQNGDCDTLATLILTISPLIETTDAVTVCDNALPYVWNGNEYFTEDTYMVTLDGQNGDCDTLATLILTISPIIETTEEVTVCDNALPYVWNGNEYFTEDTYTVTLEGQDGDCDTLATLIHGDAEVRMAITLATLILTISPIIETTDAVTVCDNALPYVWNGNEYFTEDTYTVTLEGQDGDCDTLATLILTISPIIEITDAVTVCDNALPYVWNGNEYFTEDTYTVTLEGQDGDCDTLATLILTISPIIEITDAVTVCDNALPYVWNGNEYFTEDTYTVTLEGQDGDCDTLATLILTISPIIETTDAVTVCDNALPYVWNGNEYFTEDTYTVTLEGQDGDCDTLATLILTISPIIEITDAVTVCDNALPYVWNGNEYLTEDTYTVTLEGQDGDCDTLATLILTISPIIEITDAVTVCDNALPYVWNGNEYFTEDTYTVTLEGQDGDCDTLATLILTISPIIETTDAVTVCDNALPYVWNGNEYFTEDTYTVTLEGQDGDCDTLATLILTISPLIETADAVTVCDNALPYVWNGNEYFTEDTYTVMVEGQDGDCDTLATLILTIVPIIETTESVTVCDNALPYVWNGNEYFTEDTYTVTLEGQDGDCDTLATLILTISPIIETTEEVTVCDNALPYVWNGNEYFTEDTYTVTLEGQDGDCDTLATLILTISPIIETTESVTVCDNALPYVWNGNEYFTEDTYTVTLEGQDGDCDTLATLILTISPIIETTEEVTVCDNALPYNWNGNEYFTEDTYTVMLEGQDGDCDTLATLILTIAPIIETTESVTVCDNALPYVWNGNEYFTEDTYTVTLEGQMAIATRWLHSF